MGFGSNSVIRIADWTFNRYLIKISFWTFSDTTKMGGAEGEVDHYFYYHKTTAEIIVQVFENIVKAYKCE